MASSKYNPKEIEAKWQKKWLEDAPFRAEENSGKPKYYQLETFPYPSAEGLHVGHPKGFTAEDIHARFMRMQGREVLYTMGWDAFGLPTENYAIKVGKSPAEVAKNNIKNFTRQVRMFGFSYDWNREINTSDPSYYKWTQWLFIELYKKGLAYRKKARVNWCPKDQTVLANEQVQGGICERCGSETEQREMEQWFVKITDYTERLLNDLRAEKCDWPEATLKRQEDWIGRSEGASLLFKLSNVTGQEDDKHSVEVFTTRPDTLFGATFLVISPELAQKWIDVGWQAGDGVKHYIKESFKKRELDRLEAANEKTGVDAGITAIHPATKEKIPVWVADYVLGSYGTGAIMAVPAHDERDFEFAKKFSLGIKNVITSPSPSDELYSGIGTLENSGNFDGMDSEKAKWEITKEVGGEKKIQYKLRDWSVSRQRYWGAPIPMIHCDPPGGGCGIVPVPQEDLPVLLPTDVDYRPHGMPPLASSQSFIEVKCPKCGGSAKRDPETLDTFVDSSWYFFRYTDPKNEKEIFDKEKAKHWLPVDLYVIGAEHTVLHLLYARFVTKFLYDSGYINFTEPFLKLRHQGLIQGPDGLKMSKSKGNVVNPDEVINEFGADATRLYIMFIGPFEDGAPWDPKGILGVWRFLSRVWNMGKIVASQKEEGGNADARKITLHRTIKKVTEDISGFHFNTAISALMILLRAFEEKGVTKDEFEIFIRLLHPLAPHLTQELWSLMGHESYLDFEKWPEYDARRIESENFTLVIQVNGKMRGSITASSSIDEDEAKKMASEDEGVKRWLYGVQIKKVIFVPKKLINFVVEDKK